MNLVMCQAHFVMSVYIIKIEVFFILFLNVRDWTL